MESILARSYAFVVVSLRYLIVGGWAAAVVLAVMFLPPLSAASSGGLSDLVPPGSAAAHAEGDAARLFGFPIDAAVAIVQRDPHGMPAATRDRAIRQAIAVDRRLSGQSAGQSTGQLAAAAAALASAGQPDLARILSGPVSPGPPGGIPGLAGAYPLPNAAGLLHGTGEQSTTVITFLSFRPGTSFGTQTAGANAYVHWFLNRPADHVVGVSGPVPAEYEQSQIIGKDILWVELFTVLAIALIVGLRFRSVGAPLATLACAAMAYLIAIRIVVWLAAQFNQAQLNQAQLNPAQFNQAQFNQAHLNPMLAASGGAARFVMVETTDPLDATAISRVQQLQARLPALARAAGLPAARFEVAGQTALTGDSIGSVIADLGRVALAIVAVTLVLLALFLRSLLAPVYLLAASVLAVFATLGLTILIARSILGSGSLVYFVPFAAGVLLVSLGSDYNVFVVGRIWEEARRRPVADAVAVATPQASRAITTAGVALAASFAMLALIPLEQFRQIAIAMALGVVLDAIAVRSLLIPALVALFGRLGMWPGNRRVQPVPAQSPAPAPVRAGDQP